MKDEIKEILDRMQELVKHKYDKKIQTYNLFDDIQGLLDYITNLQDRIDKAVEYITSYESIETIQQCEHSENNKDLDNKTLIEMTRRYLIVHDKLLNILKGE